MEVDPPLAVSMEQRRAQLLDAVEEMSDPTALLEFVDLHNNDLLDLPDFLQTVRGQDLGRLWKGLREFTKAIVENNLHRMDIDENVEDEVETSLMVLQSVATIAMNFLTDKKRPIPDVMVATVELLHGITLELTGPRGWALQNDIARTCEEWWTDERPGRERLVTQTVPYLVARALDEDGKVADLKRLYRMRTSLMLLDFQDESIESMKELLLRCFAHPLFLKSVDGRKLCVFLFGLHPAFIDDIHAVVKQQLPYCTKRNCEYYGEIYFKAWRGASGPYITRIEAGCIQDLMSAAVLASNMTLFNALRKVLAGLHSQKKARGVDEMLLRLYQPILWRSLSAANPHVRRNAAMLLIDAFPLHDPDSSLEAMDDVLQKQFNCLKKLLEDPAVAVRCVGVSGICRVLCVYWEVIPPATIKTLLKVLVTQCSRDSSAAAIRSAVCAGLGYLLDNQLSHLELRECLPHLSFMIHDRTPKVRASFVSLLLRIKHVRAIRFYQVVPIPDILARLAEESSPVAGESSPTAAGLVDLLVNSYMPVHKDKTTQLRRCLSLCKKNARAAVVFYKSIFPWVPAAARAQLGCQLLELVHAALRSGMGPALDAQGLAAAGEDEAEDGASDEAVVKQNRKRAKKTADPALGPEDVKLIEICLEVAVELLSTNEQQASKPTVGGDDAAEPTEEETIVEILQKVVTEKRLIEMLAKPSLRGNIRASSAIVRVAGMLPAIDVPQLATQCLERLQQLPPTATVEEYGPLLRCLVSWGQGSSVAKLLCMPFDASRSSSSQPDRKPKSGKSRRTSAAQASAMGGDDGNGGPGLSLKIVEFILTSTSGMNSLLSVEYNGSPTCVALKKLLLGCIQSYTDQLGDPSATPAGLTATWDDDQFLSALFVYGKLLLHGCAAACAAPLTDTTTSESKAESVAAAVDGFAQLFTWGSETIGSHISVDEGSPPPPAVVASACQILLALAAESYTAGIPAHAGEAGSMMMWQCHVEFGLVALRTSENVSAGTVAAMCKLLVQAHASWSRVPTLDAQDDGVTKPTPCVPTKGLRQLLAGLCCQSEAESVWPVKLLASRLLRLYSDQTKTKCDEFLDGLLNAVGATVELPEDDSDFGLQLEDDGAPAPLSMLVSLLKESKGRSTASFGGVSAAHVGRVITRVLQRLGRAAAGVSAESGSNEDAAAALYQGLQLLIPTVSGADGVDLEPGAKAALAESCSFSTEAGEKLVLEPKLENIRHLSALCCA